MDRPKQYFEICPVCTIAGMIPPEDLAGMIAGLTLVSEEEQEEGNAEVSAELGNMARCMMGVLEKQVDEQTAILMVGQQMLNIKHKRDQLDLSNIRMGITTKN